MALKETFTRTVAKQTFRLKKNSPHIFFAGGVVGIVTSTVLACKATLKLDNVLVDLQEDLHSIESRIIVADSRPEEHDNRDKAYAYLKGVSKIGKLYAPAAAVGTVSLLALTGSHIQLTRRNAALTAAYTGLHAAYNEYRARVREVVGDEKELDIHRGVKTEKVEGENGKTKNVQVIDPNAKSMYARCFDEFNPNWTKDPELNRVFLQCQQNFANERLRARGYLFLNEVYNSLGMDISKAGQSVGWVINGDGDNFVDFGIFEAHNAGFMNGQERSVWLDFNVDGVIIDKI